ncbi:MAG: UDP-N-acetylmuramoyl-L-alanine--D-glutamate ligase [Desulfobacteraceae bacterium]
MSKGACFNGMRVVVVGLARSGLSAAAWLAEQGAAVTASDLRPEAELDPEMVAEAREKGIELETGGHVTETFTHADLIVLSPGVPPEIEPVERARRCGVPVKGEMELAFSLIEFPVAAVTGTNGKSTVTALIGEILQRSGRRVFVGGNIGVPFMECVRAGGSLDCAVVEVSSFQLDTMEKFKPRVSVILNISPDHLDRYQDYDAYVRSKLRIFMNQGAEDFLVLNQDDPVLAGIMPEVPVRTLRFGKRPGPGECAWIEGNRLAVSFPGRDAVCFSLEEFKLQGAYNLENLIAAVLTALAMGGEPKAVEEAVRGFRGLPHRLERVAIVGGVDFYNDSKATNVHAAARAVESFDRPVVLIAGGRHKGADYRPLVETAEGRVKAAVFMGEARGLLAESFKGRIPVNTASGMEEAVRLAASMASPGDVVLLAPACSSFDMFNDYADRGRAFSRTVQGLANGG